MNHGLSDQVRAVAKAKYVIRAEEEKKRSFPISVKELLQILEGNGFPPNHARQVCTAITSGKFLRENGLEIERIDGPPSKTSTTVVVHYKFVSEQMKTADTTTALSEDSTALSDETPEEWAHRMTGKLFGLLKEEITAMGGTEAFIRWVRSEDEENAREDAA